MSDKRAILVLYHRSQIFLKCFFVGEISCAPPLNENWIASGTKFEHTKIDRFVLRR